MSEYLRQIVYASSACAGGGDAEAIAAILRVSRANNARDGLTGLLYADGTRFMQAIEGPREAVAATFARIEADPRHEDVATVTDREVAGREFGTWSMAWAGDAGGTGEAGERMRRALATAPPKLRARFLHLLGTD